MYIDTSAFFHTSSLTHPLSCLVTVKAVTALPSPETMSVLPYRIGVIVFCVDGVVNGRFQSSSPLAAATPTRFCCVKTITWRVPSRSAAMGDPYAGPSPGQLHLTAPVFASNAVSAPWLWLPT